MQSIPKHRVIDTLAGPVLVAIMYYVIASPAARMNDGITLSAIAWPAPAPVIALLWLLPYRRWAGYLCAVLLSMLVVGDLDWLPLEIDFAFALLNVTQIALCAWLGKRHVAPDGNLDSMPRLIRFFLLVPVGAIVLIAVLGATIASHSMNTAWWQEWRVIMVSNGLAVLVLVPALLVWSRAARHDTKEAAHASRLGALAGVMATIAAYSIATTLDTSEVVLRVMLALILVSTAIYGGMKSASLTVGTAAVLGVGLTLLGLGPYSHHGFESSWRLQVDLAGLALLSFFVATAVREKQQLAVKLERARRFESLGMLAGGIAHDFNNILGAVGGYAEMAEERAAPGSPVQEPLREVAAAVSRGKDLTEQILLAARRGDRMRAIIDLRGVLAEAVALARPLCPPGVTITLRLPDTPLTVFAHQGQITRAALNLVRNASQAARAAVGVSLDCGTLRDANPQVGDTPDGPAVWFDVADDGAGIPAEHLPRLFEPFFSVRGAGSKGTGLGLAIVSGVAIEHDGGIEILTGAQGTRFRFIMPAGAPAAPAASGSFPAPMANPAQLAPPLLIGRGQRIMVVDDDQALRERCEDWLAELGFEPLGYADPREALADAPLAPDELFLLLTDFDMPQMTGDALALKMRSRLPSLPVILCSGDPRLGVIAQSIDAHALPKPFDQAALALAVMTATRGETP